MSEKFNFENLEVCKLSLSFSINACKIAGNFPPKYFSIRDQFTRAVMSIPLNIAEGSGRKTEKDKNNFYKIARSSAFELIPILDICNNLDLIDKNLYNRYRHYCTDISKMLSGLIKT